MPKGEGAIGIFDSGVGGLTVVRRVIERLPGEDVVYLGDTARLPYGTKSAETVERYALGCARILLKRQIKLLVVACNTASAFALDTLRDQLDVPVLGVIEPGAMAAIKRSTEGRIGVIGTRGTIMSGEYQGTLERLRPEAEVFAKACPMFVPLAEEGWIEGDVPRQVVSTYLDELLEAGIDTLLLGCTHYPLLKDVITSVVGADLALVDSAEATSEVVSDTLEALGEFSSTSEGQLTCLVSDAPERFADIGASFLGREIERVEWVDF